MQANDPPRRLGFGVFGVDLRDRQLTKRGLRIRLQEQPFQVLAMLLERPGRSGDPRRIAEPTLA